MALSIIFTFEILEVIKWYWAKMIMLILSKVLYYPKYIVKMYIVK